MTDTWNNSAGGDWTSSSNWTSGVPTAADDITIGIAGGYTVSLTTSGAANSLLIDNSAATLNIFDSAGSTASLVVQSNVVDSGALELRFGATMVVSGRLSVASGGVLGLDRFGFSTQRSQLGVGGNLVNSGTIDIATQNAGVGAGTLSVTGTLVNTGAITLWGDRFGTRPQDATTADPNLHLVVAGTRLDPASVTGGLYTFTLAAPPRPPLHLRSRSAVPSLNGQSRRDHRRLGVALRPIVLSAPGILTALDHTAPSLAESGAYPAEPHHTWTDGDLALPAEAFAHLPDGFRIIVHTGRQPMRYPTAAPAAA